MKVDNTVRVIFSPRRCYRHRAYFSAPREISNVVICDDVLTWSRVAWSTVRVGVITAKAGVFLKALHNDVTAVGGAVVTFLEVKSGDGGAARRGGGSGGWLRTYRIAVRSNLLQLSGVIAGARAARADFIEARAAIVCLCYVPSQGRGVSGAGSRSTSKGVLR